MSLDDTFVGRREEELEVDCEEAFMQDLLELCGEYAEDLPAMYIAAILDTVKTAIQIESLVDFE